MTANRRVHPTGDIASTIANATIDGAPLGDIQTISYYTIIATAGHDTTSSSLAGGLKRMPIRYRGRLVAPSRGDRRT